MGSSTLMSLFQCCLLQMRSLLHWVTLALCQKSLEAAAWVMTGLPVLFLGPCTCPSANTAVLITVALQESSKCFGHRDGSEAFSCRERDGPKPSCVYGRPLPTNADYSRPCLRILRFGSRTPLVWYSFLRLPGSQGIPPPAGSLLLPCPPATGLSSFPAPSLSPVAQAFPSSHPCICFSGDLDKHSKLSN